MLYLDLKLENVLLSAEGDAVLVDFGFARCGIDVAGGQTVRRPGGTRVYTPPEGILGRPVGAACDWWALGILLYELRTRAPPFEWVAFAAGPGCGPARSHPPTQRAWTSIRGSMRQWWYCRFGLRARAVWCGL